jgi:hypothetical protein
VVELTESRPPAASATRSCEPGADPAEARHVDHDQARVVAQQPLDLGVRDQLAPVPGRAQHDVRTRGEGRDLGRGVPHRALPGVEVGEGGAALDVGHPARERAERAQRAAGGLLDQHDFGAQVGEQPPGVGEGDRVARLEDPHPGERALHISRP